VSFDCDLLSEELQEEGRIRGAELFIARCKKARLGVSTGTRAAFAS
jgi:hypothetical protein